MPGHDGQDVAVAGLRAGVGLGAVSLSGVKVDDRVDPVRCDPQRGCEIDVAVTVGIDESVDPAGGELADRLASPSP